VKLAVTIVHICVCLGLIFFILLHSGKSGGLSDMFGGGSSSTFSSTSIIQKNLDRITIALAMTFAVTTILLIRL
jgi:preprotein translocase subunit SecG